MSNKALDVQVGGGHYKDMAIQPVEFCFQNKLNNCQTNVVKYITRYKNKNGLEDLKKAKHYIDLLIQLEGYEENTATPMAKAVLKERELHLENASQYLFNLKEEKCRTIYQGSVYQESLSFVVEEFKKCCS